jgi:hypothetical protein
MDTGGSVLGNKRLGREAHPPPIQWVQEVLSSGIKRLGREALRSPPGAEVKIGGAMPALSYTPSWSVTSAQGQLYMTLYKGL